MDSLLAEASLPNYFLGNEITAIVPIEDSAKWLRLNIAWTPETIKIVITNDNHRIELKENSSTYLLDGKEFNLDFPAIQFDEKFYVQPQVLASIEKISISYGKQTNKAKKAILTIITNNITGKSIQFSQADMIYHMRADLIGNGDKEDIYVSRSYHAAVWVMQQQKRLWYDYEGNERDEDGYETSHLSYIFGVYACPIISSRQYDLIIWSGTGGNYIGNTDFYIYHYKGNKFCDITPSGLSMNYTTAVGDIYIYKTNPNLPPIIAEINSTGFREDISTYRSSVVSI